MKGGKTMHFMVEAVAKSKLGDVGRERVDGQVEITSKYQVYLIGEQ